MSIHRILNQDSRFIENINDKSVQLIITSPPYPMIEMWDGMFSNQDLSIAEDLKNGFLIAK